MGKKSNEVYKNANKEFDEQIELYRKETKSNTRKIKILSSISVVIFFIILINPFKTFKNYLALKSIETPDTEYYQNGKKKYELKYSDGRLIISRWYENGQLQSQSITVDGQITDTSWYEDGQKKSQDIHYDEYITHTTWHKNGQKSYEGKYNKSMEPIGPSTEWHENGDVISQGNFKNGKPEGIFIVWHENGKIQMKAKYDDGVKVSEKYWNTKGEPVATAEESRK